jgi:hypothetical protein
MMADHNAVCKACSEKLMVAANVSHVDHIDNLGQVGSQNNFRDTKIQREQCTCDIRMMADHNAMCEACSKDVG